MFPMDYEEFRWAMGDTATIPLLRQAFEQKIPLGDVVHRRMMRDFRLYMLVGGIYPSSKLVVLRFFGYIRAHQQNPMFVKHS